MESVTSFFFNIVPSAILILVLENKSNIKPSDFFDINRSYDFILIFLLILCSIFIGFLLQIATKLAKEKVLYEIVWQNISINHNKRFKHAKKILKDKDLLSGTSGTEELKEIFYTMDDYLSLGGGGRLLTHFASRLAYWSNIFWVSLIILILSSLCIIQNPIIGILSFLLLLISAYESVVHLHNHYDVLLKSFVSYIEFEEKASK